RLEGRRLDRVLDDIFTLQAQLLGQWRILGDLGNGRPEVQLFLPISRVSSGSRLPPPHRKMFEGRRSPRASSLRLKARPWRSNSASALSSSETWRCCSAESRRSEWRR